MQKLVNAHKLIDEANTDYNVIVKFSAVPDGNKNPGVSVVQTVHLTMSWAQYAQVLKIMGIK